MSSSLYPSYTGWGPDPMLFCCLAMGGSSAVPAASSLCFLSDSPLNLYLPFSVRTLDWRWLSNGESLLLPGTRVWVHPSQVAHDSLSLDGIEE